MTSNIPLTNLSIKHAPKRTYSNLTDVNIKNICINDDIYPTLIAGSEVVDNHFINKYGACVDIIDTFDFQKDLQDGDTLLIVGLTKKSMYIF